MSRRLPSLQEALSQSSRPTAPLPEARSVHHMEVRQIPVESHVLEDFASYLETAPFRLVADAEVYADPQQLLGLKCRHLTMALGVRQGTNLGAARFRGHSHVSLSVSYPTDVILVQKRGGGNEPSLIRDESGSVVLRRGTSVRITKPVMLEVPLNATIDLLYISGASVDG